MLQLFSRFRLIALPVLTALMLSNCSNIVAPEEKAEFRSMIPDLKKQCYLIGIKIDEKMYGIEVVLHLNNGSCNVLVRSVAESMERRYFFAVEIGGRYKV